MKLPAQSKEAAREARKKKAKIRKRAANPKAKPKKEAQLLPTEVKHMMFLGERQAKLEAQQQAARVENEKFVLQINYKYGINLASYDINMETGLCVLRQGSTE